MKSPTSKPGNKVLSESTKKKVRDFFEDEGVSRMMPGKKDYVSVSVNGKKIQKQKRLLGSTLKGAYIMYSEKNEDFPISFSKFCKLRPENIILLGASGTHNVCVCTYHQNVILLLENSNLRKMNPFGFENPSYKDYLKLFLCDEPSEDCFLDDCAQCGKNKDLGPLKNIILNSFREIDISIVKVYQWEFTDRSNLLTKDMEINEFVTDLFEKLNVLKKHDYIAKCQSNYFQEKKQNLNESELLIGGDFSENYRFIIQDCSQSYHWNTSSASIFPWVVYFKEGNEVKSSSYAMISNDLNHKTEAVASFQSKLITHLKQRHPNVTKVHYFSDGSGEQFKNYKNIANMIHHKQDLEVLRFFCHVHGKGSYVDLWREYANNTVFDNF